MYFLSRYFTLRVLLSDCDSDGFDFQVSLDSFRAEFSALSRLFEAPEWCVSQSVVVTIDPDRPGLDCLGKLGGVVDILGQNSSSQAVVRLVGSLDGFIQCLELQYRLDRTKYFLSCNLHVIFDLGEHRWLYEVALVSVPLPPCHHLGPLLPA